MVRWVIVLGAVVAGVVLLAAPDQERPLAVVGHTGVSVPGQPATTAATPVPTTATPAPKPTVVTSRSSTVVTSSSGGVTVVNEGSALASTGGNTVIGAPDGATVVNGPVTAVGNASEVRVSRP